MDELDALVEAIRTLVRSGLLDGPLGLSYLIWPTAEIRRAAQTALWDALEQEHAALFSTIATAAVSPSSRKLVAPTAANDARSSVRRSSLPGQAGE